MSKRRTRRRGARVPALAALAAGVAVAAVVAGTIGGGGGHTTGSSAAAQRPAAKTSHKPQPARVKHAQHPSGTDTATLAAATTPPPVADTFEARGHQLMVSGDYAAAVPVLRQAVAAAPHDSLTYAYALFDLGRSLRLSGDPKDAVTVLYQRLQIPNQTETVREQLQLALQALGQTANQGGGAGPGGGDAGDAGGHGGAGDHHGGAGDHHGGDATSPTAAAGAGAPQPGPPAPGAAQPVPVE